MTTVQRLRRRRSRSKKERLEGKNINMSTRKNITHVCFSCFPDSKTSGVKGSGVKGLRLFGIRKTHGHPSLRGHPRNPDSSGECNYISGLPTSSPFSLPFLLFWVSFVNRQGASSCACAESRIQGIARCACCLKKKAPWRDRNVTTHHFLSRKRGKEETGGRHENTS